mmetsp:Transcript_43693/g.109408  ORF Transcript_43693/g.109408 Transcript_43693/m.109408 type:complete len:393 (-) Transcript_43693:17-1195(-)
MWPAGHVEQTLAPLEEKVPALHPLHLDDPGRLHVPAGHGEHLDHPLCEKVPPSHWTHAELLGLNTEPSGQELQADDPRGENCPFGQGLHLACPGILVYVPAWQGEQIYDPSLLAELPGAQRMHSAGPNDCLKRPTAHGRHLSRPLAKYRPGKQNLATGFSSTSTPMKQSMSKSIRTKGACFFIASSLAAFSSSSFLVAACRCASISACRLAYSAWRFSSSACFSARRLMASSRTASCLISLSLHAAHTRSWVLSAHVQHRPYSLRRSSRLLSSRACSPYTDSILRLKPPPPPPIEFISRLKSAAHVIGAVDACSWWREHPSLDCRRAPHVLHPILSVPTGSQRTSERGSRPWMCLPWQSAKSMRTRAVFGHLTGQLPDTLCLQSRDRPTHAW